MAARLFSRYESVLFIPPFSAPFLAKRGFCIFFSVFFCGCAQFLGRLRPFHCPFPDIPMVLGFFYGLFHFGKFTGPIVRSTPARTCYGRLVFFREGPFSPQKMTSHLATVPPHDFPHCKVGCPRPLFFSSRLLIEEVL